MAKAKQATETDEAQAPSSSAGRRKLLLAAVAVVVLAAGYFVTSGGGSADAAPAPEPSAGEVVALDTITLNLADGRFLKVGLALQLVDGVPAPAPGATAGFAAPALDEAISVLGGLSYGELVAPGGRDAAKATLSGRIATRYEGDVMGVYFTELVMQ